MTHELDEQARYLARKAVEDEYGAPCTCTPAIAGISDGPAVDCPVHGEHPVRNESSGTSQPRKQGDNE